MAFWKTCIGTQCSIQNNMLVKLIGAILFLVMSWTFVYLLLKNEVLPQGGLFKLSALVLSAFVVGTLVSFISLPALLGMLITGIIFKSLHIYDVGGVYLKVVSTSRDVALTIILIKAGLGLDPKALRKHYLTVLKLSLCPCIAEACVAAIASNLIFGLPWLWGFMLGFLLSPISPAVVVPTLLNLKEKGYGEDKGIATLVIAASSIDDIFSISLFGIFMSLTFNSSDDLTMQIFQGPLEMLTGIAVGLCWGLICAFLPNKEDDFLTAKRAAMVGLGGLILVIGSKELGLEGAGPLACIVSAFTASISWSFQPTAIPNRVPEVFSGIWLVMQPILFGLIGAEIDLTILELNMVGYGLVILAGCLIVRILTCILVLFGSKLTWKECLFVNLAWLPKATVQAALSPQPMELVSEKMPGDEIAQWRAQLLLTTAVIAILVTAPIGSMGISLTGTKLLNRADRKPYADPESDPQIPLS